MNHFSTISRFCKIWYIITLSVTTLCAQTTCYKLGFAKDQKVEITKNEHSLQYAWAGGINSAKFSQIDLNLDGIPDFILFEKHGNRILPFLNKGTNTNPHFVYAPEYKYRFPELHDWVILKDFNNDGKADIFTYGLGSIRVFENISNQELTFKLVADPLTSNYYGYEANIFCSTDDYVGIEDLTGNGKLDILNYWALGKFVHLQKNISENNQFLTYTLADECWGKFSEDADNNAITLLSYCNNKSDAVDSKHAGSSIFLFDYNGDGLIDVVIGDMDFPELKLLINGGTKEEAIMVSQTEDFPNAHNPVHIYSMPVVSAMDFGDAQKPDLLVSPSDPSLTKSEDVNSVWRYRYNEQLKDYVLETKSYLQEDMIDVGSGAVPVLYDWTGNGLLDLFIANYGSFDSASYQQGVLKSYYSSSITYYKNTGTNNNPEFEWVTSDFGDLKKYGFLALFPTFADLNGDGKIDLLCGNNNGSLLFFENTAPKGELPQFNTPVNNYQNIKVDAFSTPQLFDVNKDGKLDLILGNRRGTLSCYQNVGTIQNPNFQLVTSFFGNVDVRNPNLSYFGYATPYLFRYKDETLLLCGNEQGDLFLFSNIDENLEGEFTLLEKITETIQNKAYHIKEGIRVAASVADLDGDNKPDLIVGNWAGGITYFKGCEPAEVRITEEHLDAIRVYPNPTTGELRILTRGHDPLSDPLAVEIFDIYGRKVGAKFPSNELEGWQPQADGVVFNISHLQAGIYFMKIYTNNGVAVKKVLKNDR